MSGIRLRHRTSLSSPSLSDEAIIRQRWIFDPAGSSDPRPPAAKSQGGGFPESERAVNETIAIPIYPEPVMAQQTEVAEAVAEFYA
jgi:hypothetical protein